MSGRIFQLPGALVTPHHSRLQGAQDTKPWESAGPLRPQTSLRARRHKGPETEGYPLWDLGPVLHPSGAWSSPVCKMCIIVAGVH